MDLQFENPQMAKLADCIINRQGCWLIIDPPPYTKFNTQEITRAVAEVTDAGAFTYRRNLKLSKLAQVMLKREFKSFYVVTGSEPRVSFGEVRVQINCSHNG